jgi:hypothetical protein
MGSPRRSPPTGTRPRSAVVGRRTAHLEPAPGHPAEHAAVLAAVAAGRPGDLVTLAEAVYRARWRLPGRAHGPARRAVADELIVAGCRTARRGDLLAGVWWHAVDLFLDGDAAAERGLAELRELLARGAAPQTAAAATGIEAMLSIRAGRFERAGAQAARFAAAAGGGVRGWHAQQLAAIGWYQGRLAELRPALRELAAPPPGGAAAVPSASALATEALAAAAAGEHREAAAILRRLSAGDLARSVTSADGLAVLNSIVECAHLLGDAPLAATAYDLLRPFAAGPMMAGPGVACLGSAHSALGVASLTSGDPHRAVRHLTAAVQDNLALGHWPAAALSRSRLARALALRAAPGDAAQARRERAEADRDLAELGMAGAPGGPATAPGGGSRAGQPLAACRRRERGWEVRLGNRTVRVGHSRGMQYLAVLLANPRHEISAIELANGPGPVPPAAGPAPGAPGAPAVTRAATTALRPAPPAPVTPADRQRLARLQAQIDAAESRGDPGLAGELTDERDRLLGELAAAVGLGSPGHPAAASEERARISVGKAIRRALDHVAAADPIIGQQLRATIHTGLRCCFQPL